ncbi:hypothetical protein Micbo1qcDRAFT_170453 [Microdochium bolleyi]|uniref:Uncharacterized protein n=1 Tax=Microdochium bolleyi TaxID=196109 RepID=A0A136JHN9_9PEZI|nr:hypothetical protein Micbo1qcDRAFT_170453 [Microdochium bolleyi]
MYSFHVAWPVGSLRRSLTCWRVPDLLGVSPETGGFSRRTDQSWTVVCTTLHLGACRSLKGLPTPDSPTRAGRAGCELAAAFSELQVGCWGDATGRFRSILGRAPSQDVPWLKQSPTRPATLEPRSAARVLEHHVVCTRRATDQQDRGCSRVASASASVPPADRNVPGFEGSMAR